MFAILLNTLPLTFHKELLHQADPSAMNMY